MGVQARVANVKIENTLSTLRDLKMLYSQQVSFIGQVLSGKSSFYYFRIIRYHFLYKYLIEVISGKMVIAKHCVWHDTYTPLEVTPLTDTVG